MKYSHTQVLIKYETNIRLSRNKMMSATRSEPTTLQNVSVEHKETEGGRWHLTKQKQTKIVKERTWCSTRFE